MDIAVGDMVCSEVWDRDYAEILGQGQKKGKWIKKSLDKQNKQEK